VTAVGLNFRDVLNILGMYPGDPGEPGGDVSGIVAAVGSAARHIHQCVVLSPSDSFVSLNLLQPETLYARLGEGCQAS
jgi:NADPH:quinone reductase-like Zn-dependent oxidoreductase